MKLAVIIGVFVLLVGVLLYQAKLTATSTMRLPSELAALSPGESMQRVRVAGRVSALPINYETLREDGSGSVLKLSFTLQDPPAKKGKGEPAEAEQSTSTGPTIPVVYRGVKPDMFAPGRDVIIDGNFEQGTLQATKLLTQCPSKYEPPSPTKTHEYPSK